MCLHQNTLERMCAAWTPAPPELLSQEAWGGAQGLALPTGAGEAARLGLHVEKRTLEDEQEHVERTGARQTGLHSRAHRDRGGALGPALGGF